MTTADRPPGPAGASAIGFRDATTEDAAGVAEVGRIAFNLEREWLQRVGERFRPERVTVGESGSGIVATAQAIPMRQWFGGRPVATAGIASVAILPAFRGTGVGREIMVRALRRAADEGRALATLYPATVPFYRSLGFEYSGIRTTYRVPLDALPPADPVPVVELPEDGGAAREAFRRLAERENGLFEGVDDDWWPTRVTGGWREGNRGSVGVAGAGGEGVEGYATYLQEPLRDRWGYRVACTHLVAHSASAARGLLGYFRRFKGVGAALEWHGSPIEPLIALIPEQEHVEVAGTFRNMSRILDVSSALEARGYPDVSGSCTFAVRDELFPDNDGAFLLEADAGRVHVSRLPSGGDGGGSPIGIGALTSMFASYLRPRQAAGVGLVEPDHPALPLLERLFAGPPSWTPDFF